jgi:hypothetical protein
MKTPTRFLLAADAPAGLPKVAPTPAAPPVAATPPSPTIDIASDVKIIQGIIAGWKAAPATGQLQIAIGGLGTAVDYALHHINLPAPAAPAAPAAAPAPAKTS